MATPITGALLQGAFQNFNTRFQAGLRGVPPWWMQVASAFPSDTEEEIYAWLQTIPIVREWLGARVIHRLASDKPYRLPNRDFELTVGISRNKFLDDKLGVFAPAFEMMGQQFAKWPDRELVKLLKSYLSYLCFDGLAFFNASHPVDSYDATKGTYSNLRTTTALTQANFIAMRAAMAAFKRPDGEVMGILPDTILVPPALAPTARLIVEAETIPNAAGTASQTNITRGQAKVLELPELAGDDTVWYLAAMGMPIKPLVYQERQAPVFVSRTAPDSDTVFENKEYQYGADSRGAFGYTLPFLMMRCEA